MATPNFFNGANLKIKLGNTEVAYATGISFQHNMATTGVQVLGAMTSQGIEPLSYSANGSFSVMSFVNKSSKSAPSGPDTKLTVSGEQDNRVDNTMGSAQNLIHNTHLTPRKILMSATFDIDIMEKPQNNGVETRVIYRLLGCRLTDWSLGFSPGQLASERYGFVCQRIVLESALNAETARLTAIADEAAKNTAAATALAQKPATL